MSTTVGNTSHGIGFFGMLTILFIGLKLANVITWSWWWVLCPLWAGIAIVLAIIVMILIAFLLAMIGIKIFKPKLKLTPKQNSFQERLKDLQKNRNIKK